MGMVAIKPHTNGSEKSAIRERKMKVAQKILACTA